MSFMLPLCKWGTSGERLDGRRRARVIVVILRTLWAFGLLWGGPVVVSRVLKLNVKAHIYGCAKWYSLLANRRSRLLLGSLSWLNPIRPRNDSPASSGCLRSVGESLKGSRLSLRQKSLWSSSTRWERRAPLSARNPNAKTEPFGGYARRSPPVSNKTTSTRRMIPPRPPPTNGPPA